MKALVLCEVSGIWSEALYRRGYEVTQVDILVEPGVVAGSCGRWNRERADLREFRPGAWDVVCAFPPCTHLSNAGTAFRVRKASSGLILEAAALLVHAAWVASGAGLAGLLENPRGLACRLLGSCSLECHPWWWASEPGEGKQKRRQLWLWRWAAPLAVWSSYPGALKFDTWSAFAGDAVRSKSWRGMASAFVGTLPVGGHHA